MRLMLSHLLAAAADTNFVLHQGLLVRPRSLRGRHTPSRSSQQTGNEVLDDGGAAVMGLVCNKCAYDSFKDVDIALFSAGGSISKKFGPIAAEANCMVRATCAGVPGVDCSAWHTLDC